MVYKFKLKSDVLTFYSKQRPCSSWQLIILY